MQARFVTARPTRLRGGFSHGLAIVLLALQALLWSGGPIIDGKYEASSARTQVHVEELGGTKCAPVHSHLDCLVCRTLSEGAVTSAPQTLLPSNERTGAAFCETSTLETIGTRSGVLGSRAPPRA